VRRAVAAAAIALAALVAPATATAHGRTAKLAVDYEARVSPLRPPLAGAVEARIYRADLAIRLTSRGGHRVVVLGYQGEPFLRLDRGGAFVNAASLTAAGAGLTTRGGRGWRRYARRPSVVWHDARLRALATGVERRRWTIPVRVDRVPAHLSGTVRRVSPPPAWPWLVLGCLFAAAAALVVALRSRGMLRSATVAFAWIAAGACVASAIGFAASSTASEQAWVESGTEIAFVLLGAAFLVRGSRYSRALSGALLGVFALSIGLTSIPVLLHGLVLSALPGDVARSAVALAIFAGGAAVICGAFVLFDVLAHYEEPEAIERYL
jgi:hypothetical protein